MVCKYSAFWFYKIEIISNFIPWNIIVPRSHFLRYYRRFVPVLGCEIHWNFKPNDSNFRRGIRKKWSQDRWVIILISSLLFWPNFEFNALVLIADSPHSDRRYLYCIVSCFPIMPATWVQWLCSWRHFWPHALCTQNSVDNGCIPVISTCSLWRHWFDLTYTTWI